MVKTYPYYIVEWHEGRLEAPPHLRHTPVKKMYDRGQIGGRKLVSHEVDTPEEAIDLWRRNTDKQMIEILVVRAPGAPRERVNPERLLS